jgi:DNA-binding MarR family transcriptional regulator
LDGVTSVRTNVVASEGAATGNEAAGAEAEARAAAAASEEDTARLYLVVGRLSRSLRRLGGGSEELGHGAVSALTTLVRRGPLRLGDLAAKEGVAPPTLSRVMAALVDGGFVRREPDPNDGRAFLVTATEAGERIISGVSSTRLLALRRRLDRLPAEQWQAVLDALPALEALVAQDPES